MIPEAVYSVTNATYRKNRSKEYDTPFGHYSYKDVPAEAFPMGVKIEEQDGYYYWIATPEKALCNTLYAEKPVKNSRMMYKMLTEDMRIEESGLRELDKDAIKQLAGHYKSSNVNKLVSVLEELG